MTDLERPRLPDCPGCGGSGRRTEFNQHHLGRYVCDSSTCWMFYDGTAAEWERHREARERWAKRKAERAG